MIIQNATTDEIESLTRISKEAFDTDINVGNDKIGGPLDYDSEKWHLKMMQSGNLFTIKENTSIVGGVVVFRDRKERNVLYIGRVFIEPSLHKKGLGIAAMRMCETLLDDIDTIRLETPVWNIRTNRFYTKLGYTEMFRNDESVFYQKILGEK